MEAQRYPQDYDGILAGAPASHWTHLLAQGAWDMQATLGDPAAYFPASKLPAIEAAVLASCDAADGVTDGVLDDPTRCTFKPASLLCRGAESDTCLTAPQAAALEKLYAGPRTSKGPVHPGHVPGAETGPESWSLWVTGPAPGKSLIHTFATGFFRHMVFEREDWDVRSFDLERDTAIADTKLAGTLNATNPDLGPFRKRGGKLILWHGWADAPISPLSSIDYYESVVKRMGARDAESFVRLYMVPGLQHCDGGPGPTGFRDAGALRHDPEHDMAEALERWVEDGTAPGPIVAARYKPGAIPREVVRTRPLCPYPQVARWKGSGSTDEAANFACRAAAPSR
jgi:feruloyl esterase